MPSEVVDLFIELAALPSPPGEERAVADAVVRYLRDLGLSVDEDDAGAEVGSTIGNLYCKLEPNGGGTPVFLCAHLDTVPPDGPLEPVIDEGVVRNAGGTILVLAVLIMLVDQRVAPGWMVAAIVVREFLVTALRLAALERGVVLEARDLGKLKTWSQAVAAAVGGFAAAGAWRNDVAWWALLVAVVLTWISGLDYARVAPRLWRGNATA